MFVQIIFKISLAWGGE